ncbi:MAG TPA: PilZ domain-containing protein [Planctomycetota bacterium]|nr:PilZ domain-containing protein [Planctomycetota bacterium]
MNENFHYREDPLAEAFAEPDVLDDSSSTPEPAERRRSPRFAPLRRCSVELTEGVMSVFGWGQPHLGLTLLDHSLGGVRLATREPLKPGAVVRLDLGADGVEGVEAFGEVRWSRRAAGSQYLAGVQFFDLPADKAQEMKGFLELIRRPAEARPHA